MTSKFTFVEPLDYLILDELPEEGEMVAGLYQLGTTVLSLRKKHPFEQLTGDQLSARVRVMAGAGYTRQVTMIGTSGKGAWQRTKAGSKALSVWKEKQNGDH